MCVCVHFKDCTPGSYRISCDPQKLITFEMKKDQRISNDSVGR